MLQVIPVASGRDMLKMLTKEQLYDLSKVALNTVNLSLMSCLVMRGQ